MDNTVMAAACFVHLMFGGIFGVILSNILDNILLRKLEKQLDKAIDDMFEKDLELDDLEEQVGKLNDELKQLKSKFPDVDVPAENDGYISDSSTEVGNMD